jgi:hypothetical protein
MKKTDTPVGTGIQKDTVALGEGIVESAKGERLGDGVLFF